MLITAPLKIVGTLTSAARTGLNVMRVVPIAVPLAAAVGGGVALVDHLRPATADEATSVRAVDGDTIIARIDGQSQRIRVLGIDTPETVKPGAPIGCYGPQASKNAKRWVKKHRTIKLRTDSSAPDRDRYDRLLRYVEPTDGGRDLSTVQVAGGYARVAAYGQRLSKLDDLQAAQRTARRHDRGLWGACR